MEIINLPREQIKPAEYLFLDPDDDNYKRLEYIIKENGILGPIHVKKDNGDYLLVEGFYVFLIAVELDIKEIPCIVLENNSLVGAYRRCIADLEAVADEVRFAENCAYKKEEKGRTLIWVTGTKQKIIEIDRKIKERKKNAKNNKH